LIAELVLSEEATSRSQGVFRLISSHLRSDDLMLHHNMYIVLLGDCRSRIIMAHTDTVCVNNVFVTAQCNDDECNRNRL
jgi:hypothetical protein